MDVVARLEGVSKSYGAIQALDGVDVRVVRGEVLALLGPNGAGKTTAVSLLTGLRRADRGTVELLGGDPQTAASKRRVGVTPQTTGFPDTLRVSEIVEFVAHHYPEPRSPQEALAAFDLADVARRKAGGLSGGQKRRLALALTFLGRPELVILDEPTEGLDVAGRRATWAQIRAYRAGGGTVLLTSHNMTEVEALAGRVMVLHEGRVIADDSVERVRRLVAMSEVSFAADGPVPDLRAVVRSEVSDGRLHLYTADAEACVRELCARDLPMPDLEVRAASLEDAFLHLTAEVTT